MTFRIALTPGEPAGIGPDLSVMLAQKPNEAEIVAVADPQLLLERAALLELPLKLRVFDPQSPAQPLTAGELSVLPVPVANKVIPGHLDVANASYVLETLNKAIDGCSSHQFDALLTGPVQKSVINEAGVPFSGHTEYLAQRTGCDKVVMLLATEGLRVALATTHLPLSQVAAAIDSKNLRRVIEILHSDLKTRFGIQNPCILVCGLNPHAGESGHLGREEIEIIEPLLTELRCGGSGQPPMNLIGPLPADTLFTAKYLDSADAVLAMYHDQGLPVLKYKSFGLAVNITLGLPIIRTSVDHGTALDLAASNKADAGSLLTALDYTMTMLASTRPASPATAHQHTTLAN